MSTSTPFHIGNISDMKGNWFYFLEIIRCSNVIVWGESNHPTMHTYAHHLTDHSNACFVYGGGLWTKAPEKFKFVYLW